MLRPDSRCAPAALSPHNPAVRPVHSLIELRGDQDLSTAQLLRMRLDEAVVAHHVIVDVSAVPFIDSTALGVLARAAVQRGEHDHRLVLVGAGHIVRKVLAITRLGSLLPNVNTIAEAEELLRSVGPEAQSRAEMWAGPPVRETLGCVASSGTTPRLPAE